MFERSKSDSLSDVRVTRISDTFSYGFLKTAAKFRSFQLMTDKAESTSVENFSIILHGKLNWRHSIAIKHCHCHFKVVLNKKVDNFDLQL